MTIRKWMSLVFCLAVTLLLASPAFAWPPVNDSDEPGSVIVFHKFIRGATGDKPATQFEISAICPKDFTCAGGQKVNLRAHWVCPGDARGICQEQDFNLSVTINGTVVFDANGNGAPRPPCPNGYLIAWVTDGWSTPNAIKFDSLIGDAVLRTSVAGARAYNALPIQAGEWLQTNDLTDVNADGTLDFDGYEYKEIAGKIYGTVRYESTVPPVKTDLTLLTLDVHSNLPNELTSVGLNFYNEGETLESTGTRFVCWAEQRLTSIDANLNVAFGTKGLVESTFATQPSTGDVTLIGILETEESISTPVPVPSQHVGPVVIDLPIFFPFNPNPFLPPGCTETAASSMPPRDVITCNFDTPAELLSVAGLRDYSYSLYNDSTGVPTKFEPKPPATPRD
jgi:hypothetical protein